MKGQALFDETGLDPFYIKVKSEIYLWHAEAKTYFQSLYQEYHSYLDKDFVEEFRRDFYSRLWELTLIYYLAKLSDKGATLVLLPRDNISRPDFCFNYAKKKFYLEATCASPGLRPNLNMSFAEIEGIARNIPIIEYKESLASAIKEKGVEKYKKYKNSMENDAGLILAISMAKIPFWHQPHNFRVDIGCLFPISDLKILITKKDHGGIQMGQPYHGYQEKFNKKNGHSIDSNYFFNEKFGYISAVLISFCDLAFFPDIDKYQESCKWSEARNDFMLVHNPLARTPLPSGFLPVAREITAEIKDDSLTIHC